MSLSSARLARWVNKVNCKVNWWRILITVNFVITALLLYQQYLTLQLVNIMGESLDFYAQVLYFIWGHIK
jgi:hypothetical protein